MSASPTTTLAYKFNSISQMTNAEAPSEGNSPDKPTVDESPSVSGRLVGRSLFGGFLMGLANLVPGISGGTMLLAAGVYTSFIESLSNITRFRFNGRSLLVLGCIGLAAGAAIVLLAGTLKSLVVHQRWIMYSLFIGLTLGGVPIVWRMTKDKGAKLLVPAALAFGLMALMASFDANTVENSGQGNLVMLFLAGLAGASAMILPGLSGAYLLLLMGQYVPILGAVSKFKTHLKELEIGPAVELGFTVLLPVGLGVLVGIAVVGNLFKWLLKAYRVQTLGILLGLLLGSTVGLYPFKQGIEPKVGDRIKGTIVTAETLPTIEEDDWPTETFRPSTTQTFSSIGLVLLGLGVTTGVSLLGDSGNEDD